MSGKGDKWRKTNFKKYFENWESIKVDKDSTKAKKVEQLKNGKVRYTYK